MFTPSDWRTVRGMEFSTPLTSLEITGSSDSDGRPNFARSLDNALRAALGREKPACWFATNVKNCRHKLLEPRHALKLKALSSFADILFANTINFSRQDSELVQALAGVPNAIQPLQNSNVRERPCLFIFEIVALAK